MDIRTQVQRLRAAGEYRLAGIVHRAQGGDRSYGAHTGMRSTLEASREAFFAGWDECDTALAKHTGSVGA